MTTIQVKSFTLEEYHQLTEIFLSIKIPDFFEKSGIWFLCFLNLH
ncbi:hypothetical protein VB638_09660 [Dolichospermum sp. UHCC 0684]|nr:hypothetical protein [Dolichospermum sp. UHCC 0260]MEA5529853.1 hypothetical protein [Dolichospermum sp. UHCC 0684]